MAGQHAGTVSQAEHDRQRRAYDDAADQFAAANAVLGALASAADPDVVLDTIVDTARRLCRAQTELIYLIDGDRFTLASSVGLTDELRR